MNNLKLYGERVRDNTFQYSWNGSCAGWAIICTIPGITTHLVQVSLPKWNLKSAREEKLKYWKSAEVATTATDHELYAAVSKCNSAPLHYSKTENHYTRSAKRKLFDFLCFHYAVVLSCIPMLLQKVHGERLLMPPLTNSQIWPFPLLLTFTFLV